MTSNKTEARKEAPKVVVQEIEKIWRVEDVANYLGVSRQHIYMLKNKGEIPFRMRGSLLFFLPHEIYEWVGDGSGVKLSQIRDHAKPKES